MLHTTTSVLFLALFLLSCSPGQQLNDSVGKSQPADQETWIKIDDFEATDALTRWTLADTRNDTDPRVENPQVTEIRIEADIQNHYLIKKPAAEGVIGNRKALTYRKLPIAIDTGEVYTFYIRFNVEYFPNNHVFGLSNLLPEEMNRQDYNAFEPSLRVTDKYESDGTKNDGTLMVKKGKGYEKIFNPKTDTIAQPLQENTWYEAWVVVDNNKASNGGQHYDVYFRGGDVFPQQQAVYTDADFRMKRDLPLIYFLANCNTGPTDNPYGNGGLRFDDLYMASGILLTTPGK